MSKFIDLLGRVGEQAPAPIGFGTVSQHERDVPSMALIGELTVTEATKKRGVREAKVDALLLSPLRSMGKKSLDNLSKSLEGRLWGARVGQIDAVFAAQLREAGCDFIVFDAEKAAGAILNNEEPGKIITINHDLSEEVAQAIQGLPIEGALLFPKEGLLPLTVQKLIDLQIVRGLLDKPFVMTAPPQMDSADLEAFRNAGIEGLLLPVFPTEALNSTRDALLNLSRRRPKVRPRPGRALVPQVSIWPDLPDDGRDNDDDDDDEF